MSAQLAGDDVLAQLLLYASLVVLGNLDDTVDVAVDICLVDVLQRQVSLLAYSRLKAR